MTAHLSPSAVATLNMALGIVDDAWTELQRRPLVRRQLGVLLDQLPDLSLTEARRRSAAGRTLLRRLERLDSGILEHDLQLTLRVVRFRAQVWAREEDWYWFVIDPLGGGLFGLYLPTAYCGGWLLNAIHGELAALPLASAVDIDRYLGLLGQYASLIDQFTERTAGQSERGIRIPAPQVHQARKLLSAFQSSVQTTLVPAPERVGPAAGLDPTDLARAVERQIIQLIDPAFARALAGLSEDYLTRAPDAVGLGQYPGGARIYAELVALHTTQDLTPEQVHAAGHARMTDIETAQGAIRAELGFDAQDSAWFLQHLQADTRWRADSDEKVAAFFQRYIDRLKPRFSDYFEQTPKASYEVVPLPAALQGSMTFGYYDAPRRGDARGRYFFNGANLTRQPLFNIASLTYHELMPGHHLQWALQLESPNLHPFRQNSLVNAYCEGWAEYAATLVGEIGLYEEPEERYGRLAMDAFLTCRLVVDTGMNALGWSLERAREYMRAHSGMSETEVLSESIRYACDIPGQALAYKLGDTAILAMRERMREALAGRFDIKAFHTVMLAPGALPIADLQWHAACETERLAAQIGPGV